MSDIELCSGCQTKVDAEIKAKLKRQNPALTMENVASVQMFLYSENPHQLRIVKIVKTR